MSEEEDHIGQCAAEAGRELSAALATLEVATDSWRSEQTLGQISNLLDTTLTKLRETGCSGEANRLPSSRFWAEAKRWLCTGQLQLHARTKPRGYAGDFELLSRIFENWVGDHPLGVQFDHYFQQQAAPRAVRNRMRVCGERLAAAIQEQPSRFQVASVGSGPALEIAVALAQIPPADRSGIRVRLLDLDPAALESSVTTLTALIDRNQIQAVRENLFRLPSLPRVSEHLRDADFVICLGLFDYLAPRQALDMLKSFRNLSAREARLFICNFDKRNPTRAYMEWVANWYLVHRSVDDMRDLAEQAGLRAGIESEESGACLLMDATRT